MRQHWLLTLLIVCLFPILAIAQGANAFKIKNPDGDKYVFARSFIDALGFKQKIDERWHKQVSQQKYSGNDQAIIDGYMTKLVKDNADWRVARNYMDKYLRSRNALIRKSADLFIYSCERNIAVNDNAKLLWAQWSKLTKLGAPNAIAQKEFARSQEKLDYQRKEADKVLIESTIMMTKAMLSQNNVDERGKLLALTQKQRDALIDRLDDFARSFIDWGLKSGQTTLQACVSIIREVLEDSAWQSLDS